MSHIDYTLYSAEEIAQVILSLSPDDLQEKIPQINPQLMPSAVAILMPEKDLLWKEKIVAFYLGCHSKEQLEAFGKSLNNLQAIVILELHPRVDPSQHWKISPFLVGLLHTIFQDVMLSGSKEVIEVLQHEAIHEAVQHHLTLLVHEIAHLMDEQGKILQLLMQEITDIDPQTVTKGNLHVIQHHLDDAKLIYEQMSSKMSRALGIAWNTNRGDLISKLSALKDSCQKIIHNQIGSPATAYHAATGLYAQLDTHLNQVFGDITNHADIEALDDDDPAIEALAKLSLWDLRDYWEIGLLPDITDAKTLELDPKISSEKERLEHHELLLSKINTNLEKLCLMTVKDLKAAQLYSKQMLRQYITEHSALLTE